MRVKFRVGLRVRVGTKTGVRDEFRLRVRTGFREGWG